MLGLDVVGGNVVCDPAVPEGLGPVFLHGLHALGGHFDVRAEGATGEVSVTD